MTDPTPATDPVEARLRATLAAEADRHPVTPDLEALRTRADRTVIDLHLSPRRNRSRVVAAAAVVAVLAGVAGAVALRSGDDHEPVIADRPPATGYYLPGPGWEVTEVVAIPIPSLPGTARSVQFADGRLAEEAQEDLSGPDVGSVTVFVTRVEEPDPDLMALAERARLPDPEVVARGTGGDTREYVLSPLSSWNSTTGEEPPAPGSMDRDGGSLTAVVDGLLLVVDWHGPVGREPIIDLADRWWESGGEAVALDPATGLARLADATYPGADPVPLDEVVTMAGPGDDDDWLDLYADAVLQVVVRVESPEGWSGSYTLMIDAHTVPTGVEDPGAGAAAGLTPEEVGAPLPPEVGGPTPAWESPTGIVADVPGAQLGVPRALFLTEAMTAGQARQLWAALAPASREAWVVAAGRDDDDGFALPAEAWGPTLATTDVDRVVQGLAPGEAEEIEVTDATTPLAAAPFEVEPRDGANPAAGLPAAEVDRLVADAVLHLVGGPGPIDADLFAPTVELGYDDDSDIKVSVSIEEVVAAGDRALTATEPPTAVLDAMYVLWSVTPSDATRVVGDGDDACPPLAEVAADPTAVVVLRDVSADLQLEPCSEWSALVVRLDDQQRIVSIRARHGR